MDLTKIEDPGPSQKWKIPKTGFFHFVRPLKFEKLFTLG
jgi:hypothetical protein